MFTPGPMDPFGITTTPNTITEWETLGPGVIGGAPADRAVFVDSVDQVGAVAFVGEDLERAGGCVYVAMDLSFWLDVVAPSQDVSPLAENVEHFLVTCADSDRDGISDTGEERFGTDPADPDSDHDGLCDGWASVADRCVVGELPFEDFDMDGIINPRDDDDDGDGVPTSFEVAAEAIAPDVDGDDIPAYYDRDSDGNFILDDEEGPGDYDGDGVPAIVDEGDEPEECTGDGDCGMGLRCNLAVGYCHPDAAVVPDAGPRVDAGPRADAGPGLDGGTTPARDGGPGSTSEDDGGCGCRAAGRPAPRSSTLVLGFALMIGLLAFTRRVAARR